MNGSRTRVMGLGMAVAAALVLAACSSKSSSGGGGEPTNAPVTGFNAALTTVINPSSHKSVGTINFSDFGAPDSTDPGNTYYAANWNFIRLYTTPLMTFKSCPGTCSLQLVPGIATAPGQVSTDGLSWTYHIKPGLKLSDGEPITSYTVKYAVERTYAKDVLPNGPSYFANLLAPQTPAYKGPYKDKTPGHMGLTAITTPDQSTVVFHLTHPFADFDYLASLPQTAPVPIAKDSGASYATNVISSGPYMFSSYTANKQLVLVDNPNWVPQMDTEAKQLVGKIILNMNINAAKVDSDLLAGNIQMDYAGGGVQTAARAQILSTPSLKMLADDPINGFIDFVYIGTKVPPLNNVHCRMAVEYAANKTDTQTAYGGPFAGGAVGSTSMPPTVVGYQSFDMYHALSMPTGDLAAAKHELTLCGHPSGFTTNIGYRNDSPKQTAAAQAMQNALRRVGINTTLKGFPTSTYYTNFAGNLAYVHSHDLGLNMGGWGPDFPTAFGWGDQIENGNAILAAGNSNVSELNDPVVNNLFSKMESPGLSQAQRNAIATQIDHQVMADAAFMPEVYSKSLLYRSPALTNVYVQVAYGMYNYAVLGLK
jgi:peptide/nickel transport system substrate-binding protein